MCVVNMEVFMNNTIQNTNNPNFCAKVSFINHIKKDAKKLTTILEERTKEFPNSKIEINADYCGRIDSVKIDDKFYYEFSPDGARSLEYGGDEEFIAENILRLFNLHVYEEKAKQYLEEFCTKMINEEKSLHLNEMYDADGNKSLFENLQKGARSMFSKLQENIEVIRKNNLSDSVYEDIFYKNISEIAK